MSLVNTAVQRLLSQIGANHTFLSEPQLDFALRKRMSLLDVSDHDIYAKRLEVDRGEAQQLLDELLVRESCFFRDLKPFALIAGRAASTSAPLRVLSAPSANGEEPYSVAITLLEAGLQAEDICVEALDISAAGIRDSQAGRYSESRMRHVSSQLRQRYFERHPEGTYSIKSLVKDCVNFVHGNALEIAEYYPGNHFHVVLCRNLMIYLTPESRRRLLQALRGVSTPGALLIVGHAEAGFLLAEGERSHGDPGNFAFLINDPGQKRVAAAPSYGRRKHAAEPARKKSGGRRPDPSAGQAELAGPVTPKIHTIGLAESIAAPELELITALADSGRYEEARERLLAFLEREPDSGRAYSLLAFVLNATGDRQAAIACFEKAIYLDAADRQSIEHLLLLYSAAGNRQGMATMQRKLTRLPAVRDEQ
jgi:chemotaxis protein methyltransferase WspC